MPNILIVEDDPAVRDIVQIALEREGMSVEAVGDGESALKRFRSAGAFDLVVLDIMLPGIDGISLCQELRKSSDVPVVMLTARDGERSVVLGLEVGADDYVTKPISPLEVVSRVRAHLRRRRMNAPDQRLAFPGLVIDLLRRQVWVDENRVDLTAAEFEPSPPIPDGSTAGSRLWNNSGTESSTVSFARRTCTSEISEER